MQLNCTVVLAKLFCLAREPGQKMKQSVESRAFLPMARSLGGVKKIIVVQHRVKNASKSAGSVARIERAKGRCYEEGDEHGHMWRVACACVCVWRPHKPRRVGVYLKALSLSLFFYLILSKACGLLSCEHTASIKDLFISLVWLSFASSCEKGLFTGPTV